jgi:pyruvate kinase
MMRRAKIVCTIGPASNTRERLSALIEAGMDCVRLNFSHGEHAHHAEVAHTVRELAAHAGRPVALLADLSGPKMRIGRFPGGPIELVKNAPFTLTTRDVPGDRNIVSITYKALPRDVNPGDPILLDDGLLKLRVERVEGDDIHCVVEIGGPLSNNKGLNMPGVQLSTPALTEKDKVDMYFATHELGVEYVALSFVRTAQDILDAKALARGTPVIAKIEKPEAVENLAAILDAADGAMVARGDLGVELGSEKVPLVQKRIIREVNRRGKVVITATQMLDSMMRNPRPTRAEAADVANAVLDGTDAVMLSGETASGSYPVESVQMMDAIVRDVETAMFADGALSQYDPTVEDAWEFANAGARAAALLSYQLPLKAVVTLTRDGRTAALLSGYRPRAPIVAITPSLAAARRLALLWGVIPRPGLPAEDLEETLRIASQVLAREKVCKKGDAFALVVGWPPSSSTNTVKLHRL